MSLLRKQWTEEEDDSEVKTAYQYVIYCNGLIILVYFCLFRLTSCSSKVQPCTGGPRTMKVLLTDGG